MAIGFNDLDDTVPADTAFIGEGAAKIREVKQALNTVFPNVKAEITKPDGFGTAGTQPSAADFSLLFTEVDNIVNPETSNSPIIPQGFVAMWNGDTTDTAAVDALQNKGWFLCVGGSAPNGFTIPNLQDKFVKGWNTQPVGATGGGGDSRTGIAVNTGTTEAKVVAKTVALDQVNIPAHRHSLILSIDEATSDNIKPGDHQVNSASQTIVGAAQGGGYDGEYRLAFDPARVSAEPNAGQSSKWGNDSVTAVDIGLEDTDFAHEHLLTEYEPGYYVIAYIIYAGVV
jgi:hypothetical protein